MERLGSGDGREEGAVPASMGSRQPALINANLPDNPYEPGYGEQRDPDRRATLLRYLSIVRKHRWLVTSVTVLVFMAGAVLTFLTTPMYRSVATVQIDREAAKVVQFEGVQAVETNDPGFYPTQYELLKSRSLASRVVAELNLTEDPRFLKAGAPSGWAKLRDLVLGAVASKGEEPGSSPAIG